MAEFGGGFQYAEGGSGTFSDPEARLPPGPVDEREAGTNAGASTRSKGARFYGYRSVFFFRVV